MVYNHEVPKTIEKDSMILCTIRRKPSYVPHWTVPVFNTDKPFWMVHYDDIQTQISWKWIRHYDLSNGDLHRLTVLEIIYAYKLY